MAGPWEKYAAPAADNAVTPAGRPWTKYAAPVAAAPPEDKYTIGNPMGDQGGAGGSSMPPAAKPARPGLNPETILEGEVPSMVAGEPPPESTWQNWIDPSLQQSPNAGDLLPLSNEPGNGVRLAVPNALRGLATEGPQIRDGKLVVPGVTINPETGYLGVTPETTAAGSVPSALRFGRRVPISPRNAIMPEVPPPDAPPPVTLEEVTAATRRAGPEVWRPVQPGEEPVPGRSYRMNQQTGEREVLEWGGGTPSRNAIFPETERAATGALPGGREPDATITVRPEPGAAGADITTAPIPEKTPAQRITDLEKSVTQTAEDRAGPQMRDDTPYVADIPPRPLASREFHPKNSLDEKTAIGKDEAFRAEIERVRRLRNEGMVDKLREDAGDANALDVAHEARQQVSPAELGVFENEQPTSVAGLVARIDKLLSGPEGKQRAVRTTLEDVRKSLYDADGNLETLPSRIYGARKNLTDLLKRGAKGMGDVADDVRASKHVLEGLLTDFDESITKGAGQFQDYLKQWSELSKPIDQMEFFQQYQTGSKKITDKDGYLIPTKVQKMLDDILQGHKAKGVNKAKSLTDEQINRVVAVRNELAADSLKDRLASVKGSDTFQQFMQEAKTPGRVATGLKIAAELGIGIPTAGLGNFVLQRGLGHLERRAVAKATAEAARRKQELLSPPNPLMRDAP